MSWKEKFIAWFLIFQAAVGLAMLGWLNTRGRLPLGVWLTLFPLAVAALVAGISSLRGHRWGVFLGIVVFAIQTPIVGTRTFQFSMWLGVHLDLAGVWAGHAKLGINLVGLAMLAWSGVRYRASNSSFKADGSAAA
ncbi:hypothetical protein [Dyella sp. A6]|uniref:hypothetical protein n=1 Tax=Dyella aluminiiresistens TaxID=3069105 RepID=UPI002E795C33|nr:hypothetical protein [Dyella sp. A6]